MKQRKIGHIIGKGGTIEDLQKEIPEFPTNPTTEYFVELGYTKRTAQRYMSILKKNLLTKNSSKESVQPEEKVAPRIQLIESKFANHNNLLIDTCALAYLKFTNLVEDAKHVTFIYSTIEEMDKKNKKKPLHFQMKIFQSAIRTYTERILSEPDKFMVSCFTGCYNEKYPDNILLQYLMILPKQIRPTLLTADKNLASKARAFDLDYILIVSDNVFEEFKEKCKKLGYGIKLFTNEGGMYIQYKGTHRLDITRNKKIIRYNIGEKFVVEHGDLICLHIKK